MKKKRCPDCKRLMTQEGWMIVKFDTDKKHRIVCKDCAQKAWKKGAVIVNL